GSSPSGSARTPRRSPTSTACAARWLTRSPSWRGRSEARAQGGAERVRAQAGLLQDEGAERQGQDEGEGQGEAEPPALLDPEALGDLGALRPAARDRRRARIVGDPQGPFARPARQATRNANRGPPSRLP